MFSLTAGCASWPADGWPPLFPVPSFDATPGLSTTAGGAVAGAVLAAGTGAVSRVTGVPVSAAGRRFPELAGACALLAGLSLAAVWSCEVVAVCSRLFPEERRLPPRRPRRERRFG